MKPRSLSQSCHRLFRLSVSKTVAKINLCTDTWLFCYTNGEEIDVINKIKPRDYSRDKGRLISSCPLPGKSKITFSWAPCISTHNSTVGWMSMFQICCLCFSLGGGFTLIKWENQKLFSYMGSPTSPESRINQRVWKKGHYEHQPSYPSLMSQQAKM